MPEPGELRKPVGKVVDRPIAQVKKLQRQTSRQLGRNNFQVVVACVKVRQRNHTADAGSEILLGSLLPPAGFRVIGFRGYGLLAPALLTCIFRENLVYRKRNGTPYRDVVAAEVEHFELEQAGGRLLQGVDAVIRQVQGFQLVQAVYSLRAIVQAHAL